MARVARRLALAVALAVAAVACGAEPAPTPSSAPPDATSTPPPASTSSPTSTPSSATPTPPASGDVDLPPDAPQTFDDAVEANGLPLERLAPPGARIGSSWRGAVLTPSGSGTTEAVAFSWSRGEATAPETGLQVWERWETNAGAPWRVAFAFTDRADRGVFGVRFETGDLTRDRSPDVLSFEDMGGSGGCGIWRVVSMNVGAVVEIYRKQTCDTDVRMAEGDLEVRAAVFEPGDAHCCPSAYRITRLRWTGGGWEVADRVTEPA
jgi:hypothetical protein